MPRLALLLLLVACSSCASLDEIGRAAKRAGTSELTWGPAAGAAVLTIGDWDEEVSDWAREETPLFGSQNTAENLSDAFLVSLALGMVATLPGSSWHENHKGVHPDDEYVVLVGPAATLGVTTLAKTIVGRGRPNGEDHRSFPSGHSSAAFAMATTTDGYLDHVDHRWVPWFRATNYTLAASTAWARVEAGKHYPTDVLVGAALGNFITVFVRELFTAEGSSFSLNVLDDSVSAGWTWYL